jgi:hypothetical protein
VRLQNCQLEHPSGAEYVRLQNCQLEHPSGAEYVTLQNYFQVFSIILTFP